MGWSHGRGVRWVLGACVLVFLAAGIAAAQVSCPPGLINCGGCLRACNPRQLCNKGRCTDVGTPKRPAPRNPSPPIPGTTLRAPVRR